MKKKKVKLGDRDIFTTCLPFERPIVELEKMILEMKAKSSEGIDLSDEIQSAEKKMEKEVRKVFEHLTPWQRVQVARHPLRPYTLDYIHYLMDEFSELHGDRHFSDDHAIVGGLARFRGMVVCVIGHQKGRDTKENLMRSF